MNANIMDICSDNNQFSYSIDRHPTSLHAKFPIRSLVISGLEAMTINDAIVGPSAEQRHDLSPQRRHHLIDLILEHLELLALPPA